MKLQPGLVFAGLLALGLCTYSCANGDTISGSSGSGGDSGSGGSSSGGSTGSGGNQNKGGNTGSGGNSVSSGGTTGSGGAKGGNTGSGGSSKGGSTGSGGSIVSSGGTTGSGGNVSSSGGTTGSGGSAMNCPSTFTATTGGFVQAPAHGGTCWTGYAYNFADTNGTTIMPGTSMTYMSCTTTCSLTAMGSEPIADATNMYQVYAGIGFNLGQTQAGGTATPPVTPTGSGITVSFTATVSAGLALRAQVTDGSGTNYCYTITGSSPVTIPYGSFNTKCYDTPADGVAYAKTPITAFQLQVAGGMMTGTYNIALTGVTEN